MIVLSAAEGQVILRHGPSALVNTREPEKAIPRSIWEQCALLWRGRVFSDCKIRVLPVPKGPWKYRAILFQRLNSVENVMEFCVFIWERIPPPPGRRTCQAMHVEIPLEEQLAVLEAFAHYAGVKEKSEQIRTMFERVLDRLFRNTAVKAAPPLTAGIEALLARTAAAHP